MTPAPILVLGAPYSGTAQMAAAIAEHPGACLLPELNLFYEQNLGQTLDAQARAQAPVADGLLRVVAQCCFGEQSADAIQRAALFLRRREHWQSAQLLEALLQALAPRRAVIVDTVAPLHRYILERWHRAVPQALLVHWVSEPRDQAARMRTQLAGRLVITPDFRDRGRAGAPLAPQLTWFRSHDLLQSVCASRKDCYLRIHASELGRGLPRQRLAGLMQACAWPAAPAQGWPQYALRDAFRRPGPVNAAGGFEADFYEDTSLESLLRTRQSYHPDDEILKPQVRRLNAELSRPRASATAA